MNDLERRLKEHLESVDKPSKENDIGPITLTIMILVVGAILYGLYSFFKPKELTSAEASAKRARQHTAMFKYDCEAKIKSALKSPSSYKNERIIQNGDYKGVITIYFTAKNSFGVELSQQAICTYDYNGITDFMIY